MGVAEVGSLKFWLKSLFVAESVKEVKFFHVNRQVHWARSPLFEVGQTIETGKSSNPFFAFFENYKRTYKVTLNDGSVQHSPAIAFLGYIAEGRVNVPDIATAARYGHEVAKHFLTLSREMIWELIRVQDYHDAPSRQRCMWLIEKNTLLDYWRERMGCADGTYQYVRVAATGIVHFADASLLLGDAELLSDTYEKAHRYWRGEMSDHNSEPEILFEGTLRVLEVVN